MFDVYDRGKITIVAIIIAIAVAGWIIVSLDCAAGVIIGVVVCLLLMRYFPTIIELFIQRLFHKAPTPGAFLFRRETNRLTRHTSV